MTKSVARILRTVRVVGLTVPGVLVAVSAFAADAVPTFTKDVAPILQQKCQVCHRPESMAPMSLISFQDARPWAKSIRQQVASRTMPPWHLNKSVGIQHFKNDRSLSDEQIDTIVRWVDGGAPMGDSKDMPPAVDWGNENEWQFEKQFGKPDLILRTDPYTMPAVSQDKWWRSLVPVPVTEARWVRAIEVKPTKTGRRIVHHVTSTLEQEEDDVIGLADSVDDPNLGAGQFMEWAVGKVGEIYAADAGKLILPGAKLGMNVHYHAVGEEVPNDVVEMAVYLYPQGQEPKYRTILTAMGAQGPRGRVDIAPGEKSTIQGFHVLKGPARLENFQPHMHMRGRGMSMEAVMPDGKREILSYVDNFNWNWHNNYIYAEDSAPVLPKGTVLVVTAWHDNSTGNRNNPDPRQWVGYGDRTIDEMAHAWVDVTYITQEDFDQISAKRKASQAKPTQDQ